ncbi:cytochrome c oxidase subunit II [Methylobacterium sp. A54F]
MLQHQSALALWPAAASATATEVDYLILAFTVLTLLLTVPVFLAITYFAVRYRDGIDVDRSPSGIRSNLIELSWMLIPFALTLIFFVWGARLFVESKHPPPDAMTIEAIGRQWMWKFQHPTGQSEINDLHVPIDQPIRIRIISQDVIHALYLPALRMQMAALPDRYTELWFKAERAGTYRLYCSEYCGTDHSVMDGNITIMTQGEYQEWLVRGGAQQSGVAAGRAVYNAYGCGACHDRNAVVKAPKLAGLYGRDVRLADGRTVRADETYLREKILNPNQNRLAEGYKQIMPSFAGVIPADDLDRLILYLRDDSHIAEGEVTR